jgi:cysteine synthase A
MTGVAAEQVLAEALAPTPGLEALGAPAMLRALDRAVLERIPALWALAERTGSTPLIEVPAPEGSATILAKCEWLNLGGTVKARTALAMIHDMLRDQPDRTLGDFHVRTYSGGSMHLPIASICQAVGLRCTIESGDFLTASAIDQVRAAGAELVIHDKTRGFWAIVQQARETAEADPEASFLFQHKHPANLRIHEETTGAEIAAQLAAAAGGPLRPDAWVAAIGTGGTIIGVGRALRRLSNPDVAIYGVTPAETPFGTMDPATHGKRTLAGSGGLGLGRKQPFVEAHEAMISGHFTCSYATALRAVNGFARLTGIRLGTSAAANWLAARTVAQRLGPGRTVVTVFPALITPEEWDNIKGLERVLGPDLGGQSLETKLDRMEAIGARLRPITEAAKA